MTTSKMPAAGPMTATTTTTTDPTTISALWRCGSLINELMEFVECERADEFARPDVERKSLDALPARLL